MLFLEMKTNGVAQCDEHDVLYLFRVNHRIDSKIGHEFEQQPAAFANLIHNNCESYSRFPLIEVRTQSAQSTIANNRLSAVVLEEA